MIIDIMTESVLQAAKFFQQLVDRLMTITQLVLDDILAHIWCMVIRTMHSFISTVAQVCLHPLPWTQQFFQSFSENGDVVASARCKRAVRPNNVTCLDADAHFVADGWAIIFM